MKKRITLKDHLREIKAFTRRTATIALCLLFLTLLLIARLIYLQVIQHARYKTLSNQNQLTVVPIAPNRGLIYDRNGVLLANNIPVFNLEITPDRITDIKATLRELQKIIPISKNDIHSFFKQEKQRRRFDAIPIRLQLTDAEIARFSVNQHRFPGVSVKARLIRHYFFGKTLSHVLGYVGRINSHELQHVDESNYSATNFMGKSGIEKYYESVLHGQVGHEHVETDATGRTVRVLHRTPPTPGANLYLTLDNRLQLSAEKALGNNRGAVVVINPNNGELLALMSTPGYDPNPFVTGISAEAYRVLRESKAQPFYDRAIRGQYPLASTIKPFLALEALDKNIIQTHDKIWDPGWFKLPNNNHFYRDWKRTGHGWINLKRAIVVSCDTYYYKLASLMGITRINSILTRFGFGLMTGIDMPGELAGLIPSPAWKLRTKKQSWYTGDTLISGIGQGYMLTTPLQLANATAALSTRGKRTHPHLLLKKVAPDNTSEPFKAVALFPIELDKLQVWHFVISAMKGVIRFNEGTGHRFGRPEDYSIAAKTGTAQVFSNAQHDETVEEQQDLPEHLRDHSLFIAFAPVEHPQIAIAVVVENSARASKVARQVMDDYFKLAKNKDTAS